MIRVKAGNVRAIAVSTNKRASTLPDVPTAEEQGLKGYNSNTNGGFLAPGGIEIQGGTPQDYAALINSA